MQPDLIPPQLTSDAERLVGCLGLDGSRTILRLQTDAYKELINKLAWALGSTYRRPYGNTKTLARRVAVDLAKRIVEGHGYPSHFRKDD